MITIPHDTPLYELTQLKDQIDALLKDSAINFIRPGKIVKFLDRNGAPTLLMIHKVDSKTVSGKVCDSRGVVSIPEHGWRVGITNLTPFVIAPTIADSLPPPKVAADKPTVSMFTPTDSW